MKISSIIIMFGLVVQGNYLGAGPVASKYIERGKNVPISEKAVTTLAAVAVLGLVTYTALRSQADQNEKSQNKAVQDRTDQISQSRTIQNKAVQTSPVPCASTPQIKSILKSSTLQDSASDSGSEGERPYEGDDECWDRYNARMQQDRQEVTFASPIDDTIIRNTDANKKVAVDYLHKKFGTAKGRFNVTEWGIEAAGKYEKVDGRWVLNEE